MHPIMRSKVTTVLLVACMLWFLALTVAAGIRRYAVYGELRILELRADDFRRENDRLTSELVRMQKPEWLALIARQRLNYKLPDETVVLVYKSNESDTLLQSQEVVADTRSNVQKWIDWLLGKK